MLHFPVTHKLLLEDLMMEQQQFMVSNQEKAL